MTDRVGQHLGNYTLVRLLGRGGQAEVYLGEHRYLKSFAALKLLHASLEETYTEQFLAEAQTLARLVHPAIVRVLDYTVEQGTPVLIMDYSPAGTMRQRYPDGTWLPLSTVVSAVSQVASALHYAHSHQVIHRDVKPENLLLGPRDEVLLSDFGLSVFAPSAELLSTQAMAGTLPYMAPEQLQGHPCFASDQYSLAIVAYEWLTGRRPFTGSPWQLIRQHLDVAPPPLRAHTPAIPEHVEAVVLRALAKEPDERYDSVQSFARALAHASQQAQVAPAAHSPQRLPPVDSPHELLTPSYQQQATSPAFTQATTLTRRTRVPSSQQPARTEQAGSAYPSLESDQHDRLRPPPGATRWMLPYPRNLFFLGRDDVLAQLARQLHAGQTIALSQPQAISGLGGVGKTQVALEYAYRHAQDYRAVFWTRADSREALVAGFLEMAHVLNLPQRDERDQTVTVAAVKSWLSQHTSWLLILDNADELVLLPEFLPAPIRGHLLLTTRAQALGRLANCIEIETLDPDTAALLLLRRAGLLALDAPLAQAEQTDRQAAGLLSAELGGLPLALDQAGAYLEETGCGLEQYLALYRSHRAELLRQRGGVVLDHPDSVATTWSLSFARVQQRSALGADLLRLCAVLHPDAIPEELFLQGAAHLGPQLATLEQNALAFNQAFAVIQSYSLLRRSSREQTLSIHRLVQAVLQDAMTNEERDLWRQRAIAALNAVFPEVRHQVWGQWGPCGRLLPHVLTVVVEAPTQQHRLELACLLTKTADYLRQRAHYGQAEPLYQRALQIHEQMLGDSHPQVAFPLNGLADLYREQSRYGQAEPLYQRALHLWEQAQGPQQCEVPSPLNNLAILYCEQGRYEQAELLLQRVLHLDEQALGQEHPKLAAPLNNLAILYCEQGRYEQAEPLLQRALHIDEQAFGQEHPEVAFSLTNLAELYCQQGRYEQAEPLYQRALQIREQTLGDSHPQVAFPLNGLANLYREQGYYEQAEPLYQRALTIRQQQRGTEHPETAESLHDFARFYELRNQPDKALALYQQVLAIRQQRLGPEHPRTRETRTGYMHLLRACGRSEEAAALEAASSQTAP